MCTQFKHSFVQIRKGYFIQIRIQDLAKGPPSSDPPKKCIIWASKMGGKGAWAPGAPMDPLLFINVERLFPSTKYSFNPLHFHKPKKYLSRALTGYKDCTWPLLKLLHSHQGFTHLPSVKPWFPFLS